MEQIAEESSPRETSPAEMATKVRTGPPQRQRPPDVEEDLGIYEDMAECDDLSDMYDSEGGDPREPAEDNISVGRSALPSGKMAKDGSNFSTVQSGKTGGEHSAKMSELVENDITDDRSSHVTCSGVITKTLRVSISDLRHVSGTRAKANTPASYYTDMSIDFKDQDSRNASRLNSESREAMYRRAMTLLSARCTSIGQSGGAESPGGRSQHFGVQIPQYFYVQQSKPTPMPPLKAWEGYNGNVYFEPIHVRRLKSDGSHRTSMDSLPIGKYNEKMQDRLSLLSRKRTNSENFMRQETDLVSSNNSSKNIRVSPRSRPVTRQMVLLDKQTVINRFNESAEEELTWIEGQESTGSLAIRPRTELGQPREQVIINSNNKQIYNKEKICKGSVVHKLYVANKSGRGPLLAVVGDKFSTPTMLSPLLRTQTQYSLSNTRLTTNSPDPYHLDKLPPLEQFRASLKRMDNIREDPFHRAAGYGRAVTLTTDLKPFIKYSPDIKAKFERQAHLC